MLKFYSVMANFHEIVFVNPGKHFANLQEMLKNLFMSSKQKRKAHFVYDYLQLATLINLSQVSIASETRMVLPKAYTFIKIAQSGKEDHRVIKLTPKSLLVIDMKDKSIMDERLLIDIEYVSAPETCFDVRISLKTHEHYDKGYFGTYSDYTVQDAFDWHLVAESIDERTSFMTDMFEITCGAGSLATRTAYRGTFSFPDRSLRECILQITVDSMMLVVNKSIIHWEVPLLLISDVKLHTTVPNTLLFRLHVCCKTKHSPFYRTKTFNILYYLPVLWTFLFR